MAATEKTVNYTEEQVQTIVALYEEFGNDGLDQIAEQVGKSVRSVRSKLVREGVYIPSPKKGPVRQDGPSKKELLRDLETKGFDVTGFEGATKHALSRLSELLGSTSN